MQQWTVVEFFYSHCCYPLLAVVVTCWLLLLLAISCSCIIKYISMCLWMVVISDILHLKLLPSVVFWFSYLLLCGKLSEICVSLALKIIPAWRQSKNIVHTYVIAHLYSFVLFFIKHNCKNKKHPFDIWLSDGLDSFSMSNVSYIFIWNWNYLL